LDDKIQALPLFSPDLRQHACENSVAVSLGRIPAKLWLTPPWLLRFKLTQDAKLAAALPEQNVGIGQVVGFF
jgi:hypothetical protein